MPQYLQRSFSAQFLIKVWHYHEIFKDKDPRRDKTQMAGEIIKALTHIIPKIKDKIEVDIGKIVSNLLNIGVEQHTANREHKASQIINRLGIDKEENI